MSNKRHRAVEHKPWLKFFSNGRFKSSEAQCVVHTVKGSKMTICLHDSGVMQLDMHNFEKASKLVKKANERVMRLGDRIEWKDPWYLTLYYEGEPLNDLDVGVVVNPAVEAANKYTYEAYVAARQQCDMSNLDQVTALRQSLEQARNSELTLMNYERETKESQLEAIRASAVVKRREIEEATNVLKSMMAQINVGAEVLKQLIEVQTAKRSANNAQYDRELRQLDETIAALRNHALLSEAYTDMLMAKGALEFLEQQAGPLISQAKLAQARQAYTEAEERYKAAAK